MWLEFELLKKPCVPGFYCVSTSYRQEPNPIAGRHDLIFPMFEFELRGDVHVLRKLEDDLLQFLGFGSRFASINYEDAAKQYGVTELQAEHEGYLERDLGRVVFLERFPERTSPFWNMRRNGDGTVAKIDVLLHGIETIGSAERSTDKDEMRSAFHNISNGMYAEILYSHFGRKRVEQELEMFLSFDFFPRCGGGMGITRLIRAMKLSGLLC
jgi:aspartyl/asparaginyl-tRNA synthetase